MGWISRKASFTKRPKGHRLCRTRATRDGHDRGALSQPPAVQGMVFGVRQRTREEHASQGTAGGRKGSAQVPALSVDYGYFGEQADPTHPQLPVLIMYDRRSGAIRACPMPVKGTGNLYCGRAVLQDIESLGYKRVVVKSDQEVFPHRSHQERSGSVGRRNGARAYTEGAEPQQR